MRIAIALLLLAATALAQQSSAPFEIRDGDRVLLLGDVLLEREGTYGAIETRMVQQFPNTRFTVRNLSWSGETPVGIARASFDPPAKGWERLQQQIAEVKPTVVILGFGMAASLQEITDRSGDLMLNRDTARYGAEPMTAERFGKELEQLAAEIAKGGEVRLIFLSPIAHQDLRAERHIAPDLAPHNNLLAAYARQIAQVAEARHGRYVSLLELKPETTNGIHCNGDGYRTVADQVAATLGWNNPVSANAPLRDAIIRKNLLFFHRFRPANETYLFGFRKHEQGQNAKEIPLFDPLIARAEEQVEALKKAAPAPTPALATKNEEPGTKNVPPPLPDFDVQPGFEIALWATNPLLEKPVQMNWDSDGRLWVASSSTYPQVNPEDVAATLAGQIANAKDAPSAGNDRIIILEDTDHDGKADKSVVFADGLLIPTAVAPFRNAKGQWACYVGQSTQILELTDTDGDGRADQSRIVQSGFGTEDTHHLVHTMKWGPDGRLYFDQSIYIHTHMETPWGMVRLNSGGIISWDPRTEKVEVHFKGFCNPWGHVWDDHGQSFITDGAGFQGVTWGIPGAMYFTYEHGQKLCPSVSPGSYPKFCSLEIIQSPHFPADWQGSLITCDFRAHRIVHFGLNDLSLAKENPTSGYITVEQPDLVRTSDLSFRPIDVRLGPDGALYVADWSNPVINHGEVDFRDPRRDHHMGRVWKITRKDAPLEKWEKLTGKSREELAPGAGQSANAWTQRQAWVEMGGRDRKPLNDYLQSSDARDYAYAVKQFAEVLHYPFVNGGQHEEAERSLLRLTADANPRVRLEAMRSATRYALWNADTQSDPAPVLALIDAVLKAALNAPANDPYYEYAAWLSINDLAEPWTKAVLSGAWKIDSPEREKQLEIALNALDPRVGGSVLAKTLEGREISGEGKGPWVELIGRAGGVNELRRLFDALTAQKLNPDASARALAALADATRLRNVRPTGDLAAIETLLSHENPQISAAAAQLIGAWKTPHALTLLREAAGQGTRNLPVQVQVAAVRGLQDIGGPEVIGVLQNLTANQPSPAVPRAAAVALASLDVRGSLAQIVAVLNALPQEQERLDTWRAVLAAKGAPGQLANALSKGAPAISLAQPVAQSGLRVARELGRNGQQLVAALTPTAGVVPTDTPATTDYSSIVSNVKTNGDPAKGEEVYRRLQLACTTCHAIGGAGGKVGPELTSLGASAPLDYIIESVLVPQAKVKEGFHAVSLTLKDGSAAVGIQSRETAQEVFLRDASGKETSVPKANITGRETIGSIMPAGLVEQLKSREQIDLYAFLSQLGKPGPYDASKGTVARYWALLSAGPASKAWPPANAAPGYTLVDGRLTKEQFETALQFLGSPGAAITAQARFQAPTAGPTTLRVTGATAATLDEQALTLQADGTATPNLATGEHTVSVQVDPKNPPAVLRVEGAQVRFLGN
jgi:putative heme-binding domain-containing protein